MKYEDRIKEIFERPLKEWKGDNAEEQKMLASVLHANKRLFSRAKDGSIPFQEWFNCGVDVKLLAEAGIDNLISSASEEDLRDLASQLWGLLQRQDKVAKTFFGMLASSRKVVLEENAKKGFTGKVTKNAKAARQAAVRELIHQEWITQKNAGSKFTATGFAKEMGLKHHYVLTVERIKNLQTTWNKEYLPAR